ncbi:F-box/kelch-repeat protein At3g06240-like [Corylus avellana]|uniref:F-box/kelch-repeat protein At3g06240-like n=1 Tax=Corylus avellana TaxID=13451 RepID=UPI00286D2B7C|nr:F-box/kelch-repeat protein At3g06240-like [Corylus avellana]
MANELPEDLVTQILLWLPVVSLLRFKCVCKSWYALITHQNFVRKHLLHNKNSNTHLLLKTSNKTMDDYVVSRISYEGLQITPLTPLTQPVHPQYFRNGEEFVEFSEVFSISVVGSCNGLVCIHAYDKLKVVIWNPTTRETKVVPESNLPIFAPAGYCTHIQGMGFGFDAKTNDYKIINFCFIVEHVPMTYITGMGSWLAYVDYVNQRDLFVLSFDMSNEVFLKTPLPDNVNGQALLVLNESIAMVAFKPVDDNWREIGFDIWLLLKVGVKDSWNRLFTIGPSIARIHQPLGFWKNDTMFLTKIDSGQLFLYDPSTQQITDLQIHGHSDSKEMQLVTYMETLVSVKGGNEFEE